MYPIPWQSFVALDNKVETVKIEDMVVSQINGAEYA